MYVAKVVESGEDRIGVFAPAKVNLWLRVGAGLPGDKRHTLLTVFRALDLGDYLQLRPAPWGSTGDTVRTCFASDLPRVEGLDGPDNLVRRALVLLREVTGKEIPYTEVEVEKHIPVAGGMAGGSADAAGTLLGANELYGLGLSGEQLLALAACLGSDVPFALLGGTALGRRYGDELELLEAGPQCHWALAINRRGLSTPQVFQEFDRLHPELAPAPRQLPADLETALTAPGPRLATELRNDLEEAAVSLRPELGKLIQIAQQAGGLRAVVSGSGPTLAVLCSRRDTAQKVGESLVECPEIETVVLARG